VGCPVGHLQRMIQIARSKNRQHWAEDFLLSDTRLWGHVVEDMRRDVVALILQRPGIAGVNKTPLALAFVERGEDPLIGIGIDDGAYGASRIFCGGDLQTSRRLD